MSSRTSEVLIWKHEGCKWVEPPFRRKMSTQVTLEHSFTSQDPVRFLLFRPEVEKRPTVCSEEWRWGRQWKFGGDYLHINQEKVCLKWKHLEKNCGFLQQKHPLPAVEKWTVHMYCKQFCHHLNPATVSDKWSHFSTGKSFRSITQKPSNYQVCS